MECSSAGEYVHSILKSLALSLLAKFKQLIPTNDPKWKNKMRRKSSSGVRRVFIIHVQPLGSISMSEKTTQMHNYDKCVTI